MFKEAKSQDLIKYGIIPEFIGRFPVVAALEELSEEDSSESNVRDKKFYK